ncbi:MAG: tetratricopeptide repeat protein [Armatimonadetes bacterium]|nr:tetratricopeptide repeat protein [Armatimonadota bacterium]
MGNASQSNISVVPGIMFRRTGYVLAAIIVIAVFVAYWPAMHGGFVWDDDKYVSNNHLLTAPDGLKRIWFSVDQPSQYFPLVYTTFRLEYALWGLKTTGYHVTNIILHILNALLIWFILRKLSVKGAWLAAAVFALHPVHVESVAWITERKNVLSTVFYLLTVLSWMRFRDRADWRFYGLALVLSAMALFAKTTASTIPAALLLVSWLRRERIGWLEFALITPFVTLGVGAGLISIWWEKNKQGTTGEMFDFTVADRILIAGRALWFYLGKLILPVKLAFSYSKWNIDLSQPPQYLWPAGCAAVAGVLWWFRRTVGRAPIAAGIFFVAALVPMLGFFSLFTFRYSFVADHYQYIASLGPIALISAGLAKLGERLKAPKGVGYVVPGLIIAVLGVLTWNQAHAYQSAERLWRHTVANSPESWLAHNNLATLLNEDGRSEEALAYAEKALRLDPNQPEGQDTMGCTLLNLGRGDEALPYFRKAIELNPAWVQAYFDYGVALQRLGRLEEAIEQYGKAVNFRPDYAEAELNLGVVLMDRGRFDEALPHLENVIGMRPDWPDARNNYGFALSRLDRIDEAIEQYKSAIELRPDYAKARLNLGVALISIGRFDEAITHLREALSIEPDFVGPHSYLAVALYYKGMYADSWSELHAAERNGESANPAFVKVLSAKMPDPGAE